MNKSYSILLIILIIVFHLINSKSFAQEYPEIKKIGKGQIFFSGILNGFNYNIYDKITGEQRKYINEKIAENIIVLKQQGKLIQKFKNYEILFELPLKLKDGLTDQGFYSISAYVDHDTLYPNHILDYNCGNITYDLDDGYNHTGTDFFTWPFPWYKMDNDEAEVIAAASGIIVLKQDGNFDRNCEENYDPWNAIYILHEDGSITWYGHFKKNSLTAKNVGETVNTGEFLGIVGGSGSSITPHLHFEVHDADNNLIDPFHGPCNSLNNKSWWIEQLPYKDAGINKISTNFKLPVFPECPEQEIPNESNNFYLKDTVFLLCYFRNLSTGDSVNFFIYRPDNTLWTNWTWSSTWQFYTAAWLYHWIIINNEMEGIWKYKIVYKDKTYEHFFEVLNSAGISNQNKNAEIILYPNPASAYINIEMPESIENIHDIKIYDLLGNDISNIRFKKIDKNNFRISILNNIKGIFFLQLTTKNFVYIEKFMIN